MIQIHAHKGISRLHHRKKYRHICLCAGMGLYIDIFTAKELLRAVSGQILHHVHALAAAVIPLSRIAFRILVCQRAAHSRHNRPAHPVLGSDQLNMGILSVLLVNNRLRDFRIYISYLIQ